MKVNGESFPERLDGMVVGIGIGVVVVVDDDDDGENGNGGI